MFSEKYLNEIRTDQELVSLRREYYDLTRKAAGVDFMHPIPIGEWKENLRKEITKLKEKL